MDTGTFRTAFNGFNKQDVLNHIEELHRRNQVLLAELEMLRSQLAASGTAVQQGAAGIPDTVTD
ncbi:MAG: hypothetical protein FWE80_04730 [Oscillospiraceae bacterium]|nr:hypothetical protein [Oscillospiraceae bacterium]